MIADLDLNVQFYGNFVYLEGLPNIDVIGRHLGFLAGVAESSVAGAE